MSLGNAFPVRSTIPDTVKVQGVWTGGGAAANMTKATADWNRGIASVAYNAATGKYKVTFVDCGQQLIGGHAECVSTTGVITKRVSIIRSSFSASAKTVEIEVWTPATELVASALVDLVDTFKVMLSFEFAKNGPDA